MCSSDLMKELVIALAGPLVSLLLFLLFRTLPWEAGALGFLGRYLALVNLGLALFNLLPIPALDGGRILLLFLGRFLRLRPEQEATVHYLGFLFLLLLLLLVTFQDLRRLLGG